MGAIFVAPLAHILYLTRHGSQHVPIDARLLVEQLFFLPGVDLAGHLEVDIAVAAHLVGACAVRQDEIVAQVGRLVIGLVYLIEPHQGLDERTIAARVLRVVARAPGDAAVVVAVGIQTTVPAVDAVVGQILSFLQVVLVGGELVGSCQLAANPHLVVVDILDASDGGCALRASAMHAVDAPGRDAGIGVEGIGATIVVE